ncbi:MAG TPA: cell division protein FtsK [Streptosporangiaceae bacterium]|nr:cell division protein FtsK [Streptosporangiaceae bacterium]
MRRHARRMRRYGLQPMVVINSGDQLPDVAATLVARAVWRYRSELAPFVTAAVLALTGLWLHATRPLWWPIVLLVTVAGAALVLARGHRWLDRRTERLYAAAVLTTGGGWLTAATVHGLAGPLRSALLIATLTGAIPWWFHRRRRARVRVERTVRAWPDIADTVGLPGSRLLSAVVGIWGWRARLALKRGQTVTEVINKIPAIESGLGTRPGAVRVEPDPSRADHCTLHVLDVDPHAKPIPWPGPTATTITDPVELGVFEDATPVRVALAHRHALIGGIAGSGKSGLLNDILAALTACPDVVIWGIDLKGGMELQPWASCLDTIATTPTDAAALLADAVKILNARADALTRNGARLWAPEPAAPALVIVIDEYAELADEAPDAATSADSIARRGRAVAVTLLAATQRPTQDAMGKGAVRSQMDIRICLRVRERRDTDLILGQGAHAAGWHPHTLDAPGKFLISAPGHTTPKRARAYHLTDERIRAITRRHAPRRPPLDPVSADAITPADNQPDPAPITDPEQALLTALRQASPEGLPVSLLIKITGMRRTWIYQRLQQHAADGTVTQVTRGRWRATTNDTDHCA